MAIQAIELLDEADRKADAAVIADLALTASPHDARLHAYAGMLRLQLGEFDSAREHYLFVMENSPQACEWNAPYGLSSAQRYREADHPDFARFQECLTRRDLSERARSVLLFALGKAYDDIGDYARASSYFRQANILARSLTQWSRHAWRRGVAARLATGLIEQRTAPFEDLVPVFIVGMPRSGTTLLAEQLARFPRVRNRGELPWLARVGKKIKSGGSVEDAAALYAAQIRQDDWGDAHWFVDKQPLNFRYLDIALAMFPNAKVIHCARNARDTALSLWTQSFAEEIQGYAYDFNNIALVMHDCECLIAHWRALYADSIRRVCYEELVRSPKTVIVELLEWLGIKYREQLDEVRTSSINTASVWQARQPIYSSSVGRWRNYIGHVPELASFRAEE
ncbi:MAG: sulfotransferase [Rhodanobacteraceae bacterium]